MNDVNPIPLGRPRDDGNGAQTIKSLVDLRDAVLRGNLIVIVGAGLSKGAGYPDWSALVNELIKDLGIDPSKMGDGYFLRIPQIYYEQRSRKEYLQRVREILGPQRTPTHSHRLLMDLGAAHIITTNYDNLLEEAATTRQRLYEVVPDDKSAAYTKSRNLIVKMHGDLSMGNIVLKEEDYLSYSRLFPLVEALVKGLIATHTVLFLGFSFSDWNMKNILRWIQEMAGNDTRPCYLFGSGEDTGQLERQYLKQRGIHLITYGDITNALPSLDPIRAKVPELKKLRSNAIEVTNQTDQTSVFISCLFPHVQIHSDHLLLMTEALEPLSGRMCVFHQEIEGALKPLDRNFHLDTQLNFYLPPAFFNSLHTKPTEDAEGEKINSRKRDLLGIISRAGIQEMRPMPSISKDANLPSNLPIPTPRAELTDRIYEAICQANFAALHGLRQEFHTSADSKEVDRLSMDLSFIAYMLNDYSSIISNLNAIISRTNPTQRLESWMRAKLNWFLLIRHLRQFVSSIQEAIDGGDLHEGENPQLIYERLDHVQKRSVGYVPLLWDFDLIYREHQILDVLLQEMLKKKESVEAGGFTTRAPESAAFHRADNLFRSILLLRLNVLHYSEVRNYFRKAVDVLLASLSMKVNPRRNNFGTSPRYESIPSSALVWIVYFFDAKEIRKRISAAGLRGEQFDDAAKRHLLDMFANLCTSASNRGTPSRSAIFSSALFSPATMLDTSLQLLAAVDLDDKEFEAVVNGCRKAISAQVSITFFESWYFLLGNQLTRRKGDFPTSQLTAMLEDLIMKLSRNEIYFEFQQAIERETFVTSLVRILSGKSGEAVFSLESEERFLANLDLDILHIQRILGGEQSKEDVKKIFSILWKWQYIVLPVFSILRDESKNRVKSHFESIVNMCSDHYDKMRWLEFVHLLLLEGVLQAQEIQERLLDGLLAIRENFLNQNSIQFSDPAKRAEEMIGNLLRHDSFTEPSLVTKIRSMTKLRSPYLAMALDVESALEREDFEIKILVYLKSEEHQALREKPNVVRRIIEEYHRLAGVDNDHLREVIYEKYILPQFTESTGPIAKDEEVPQ